MPYHISCMNNRSLSWGFLIGHSLPESLGMGPFIDQHSVGDSASSSTSEVYDSFICAVAATASAAATHYSSYTGLSLDKFIL